MSDPLDADQVTAERKKHRIAKYAKVAARAGTDPGASTAPDMKPKLGGDATRVKTESKSDIAISTRTLLNYEESEIANRDPKKDLELHKAVCDQLRNAMRIIHRAKVGGSAAANLDETNIEELKVHATLQFVSLKKLNRVAHFRCKKVRDGTSEAKQKIDAQHLKLQNLLYEVSHLQKEINKCLQFCSKDEEIPLVGINQFYAEAPPEISQPEVTRHDVHQLTLARLDWELQERKRLSAALTEAQTRKDEIVGDIEAKSSYIRSLQPKLKAILQATKPVQEHLEMPFDDVREQHRVAADLPAPLYVFFVQAMAYGESCDKNLTVAVQGDAELARAEEGASLDVDNNSDNNNSDGEEVDKGKGKRRYRHSAGASRLANKRQRLLRKHPLSVLLTLRCRGSTLYLTFHYLVVLNIITVSVRLSGAGGNDSGTLSISGGDLLSSDSFLACLYADDYGTDTPNPANRYLLASVEIEDFSQCIAQTGKPYLWAQHLCGLQFPPTVVNVVKTPQAISAAQMEDTIQRLHRRVAVRHALQKQLTSLEQCSILTRQSFPGKITSRLVQWRRSTLEDFLACHYTSNIVSLGFARPCDLFFSGAIEHGSALLSFQVIIGPDYPHSVPMFALSLRWKTERTTQTDEAVRAMEAEVNVGCVPQGNNLDGDDMLLTSQMQHLLICFDVFLETEVDCGDVGEGPAEFSREKICPRLARGPDRAKPFFYNALGFFAHR